MTVCASMLACVCIIQSSYFVHTADNARARLSQTDDESDYVNASYIDVSLLLTTLPILLQLSMC